MPDYPYPGPRIAPAARWEMYGIELALGDWKYQVDQGGLDYGPGLYPFCIPDTRLEQHPQDPKLWHRVPTGAPPHPVSVRLSPDIATYAWGNEYVALHPFDHRVLLWTRLFDGRDGAKVMVRPSQIELDLATEQITLPEGCPDSLLTQATTKAQRALDLLRAARAERDSGAPVPRTVLEPVFRAALDNDSGV
jgi:hypothetical protein